MYQDWKHSNKQGRTPPSRQYGEIFSKATKKSLSIPTPICIHNCFFKPLLTRLKRQLFIQYKYKTESLLISDFGKKIFLCLMYSSLI